MTGPQPGPVAYRLRQGSPAVRTGTNLTLAPYNLMVGQHDDFKNPVPNVTLSGFDVGAQN